MSDNSRLAKNTLYLYLRMAIIMIVKLYTSRVLLNVLGIDDYGVWNAVAAFVISFSFISNPLITATQRFLNFDMGNGRQNLSEIFGTSLFLFFIICLFVGIGLETIGLWFLNHKMNFPPEMMGAVIFLFHFSVLTLLVNLMRMPYEASIVAEERMSFYAGICILEAFSLLIIAFLIKLNWGYNKLEVYGCLNLISALLILGGYILYTHQNIPYTVLKGRSYNKQIMKDLTAFSGWNLFGACAAMSATQGIVTLINIFFGVVVNAAYGIAVQIQGAVNNVIFNLQKAANPQIVKSFSIKDLNRTKFLVINVSKYSFILSLIFVFPLIFNIDFVLHIWLGTNIPPMAGLFSSLILVYILLVSFSGPMDTAILASGKIKKFQLTYSLIIFSNIFFVYLFFKIGLQSYWALIVKCIVEVGILVVRMIFLQRDIELKLCEFIKHTIIPCGVITVIGGLVLWIFAFVVTSISGFYRLIVSSAIFIVAIVISTWYIAISADQRKLLRSYLHNYRS